jgi:glycosyltransferase involved in cell wall biosynthesis
MVSVIVPCYNAAATLAEQLDALSSQGWNGPWEVVVADNGSADGSVQVAASYVGRLPGLRILDASQHRGAAYARNEGVRAVRGEHLAFVDADDVVGGGWLAAIAGALERHEFVASRFDLSRLNRWAPSHPQAVGLQRAGYAPFLTHAGACGLAVRRTWHERVGGFDEALPGLEDTDYCFRVQARGAELHFVPEAVVHVRERPSARGLFRQMNDRAYSATVLARRYAPTPNGIPPGEWSPFLRDWFSQLKWTFKLRHRNDWQHWAHHLGWLVGLMRGSLEFRQPPPRGLR